MLWAKENKDVSSAKILHVDQRPSLGAVIYIKNKRGPRTEHCGTLDFITFQEEFLNLRTTFLEKV